MGTENASGFSQRYLALGDSFTEGLGDPHPDLPNQVRGWADRVAEVLTQRPGEDWGYANLAIRGKKIPQVLSEQIDRAVELQPTLVSLYAGGNDILRARVDLDDLAVKYYQAIERLTRTGAQVVIFTGFDSSNTPVFGRFVGRVAVYNERIREIADATGATIADYWRWREFRDPGYWSVDRLHMNPRGHELMSRRFLTTIGIDSPGEDPAPLTGPQQTRWEKALEDGRWAVQYVGPWIQRRVRGVSSGDHLQPRYPQWHRHELPAGVDEPGHGPDHF